MSEASTVFICRRGGSLASVDVKKYKCLKCKKIFLGEEAYKDHKCPHKTELPK